MMTMYETASRAERKRCGSLLVYEPGRPMSIAANLPFPWYGCIQIASLTSSFGFASILRTCAHPHEYVSTVHAERRTYRKVRTFTLVQ